LLTVICWSKVMPGHFGKRKLVTAAPEANKAFKASRTDRSQSEVRLDSEIGRSASRPLSYMLGAGLFALAAGLIAVQTLSDHPHVVVEPAATLATLVDQAPVEEENVEELLRRQQAERERMDREDAEREKQRQEEDERWQRAQEERARRNAEEARHAEKMDLERKTAARLQEQHREQIEQNERIAQQRARAEQQRRKEEERRHQERLAQEKRTEKAIREGNKPRGTPGAVIVPTQPTKRMFGDGPGLFERD
jgi:DNA segregation ATPase FtsK/SpoIIIE-like protein